MNKSERIIKIAEKVALAEINKSEFSIRFKTNTQPLVSPKGRSYSVHTLFELQEGLCAYCSAKIQLKCEYPALRLATKDHVLPRCHGGTGTLANIVLACRLCNGQKGSDMPTGREMIQAEPIIARMIELLRDKKIFDEYRFHFDFINKRTIFNPPYGRTDEPLVYPMLMLERMV